MLDCYVGYEKVFAGSNEMFETLDRAKINLSGSREDQVEFMVAVPLLDSAGVQSDHMWGAYLFRSKVGEVMAYMRESMLYDMAMLAKPGVLDQFPPEGSEIYDCEFAQLAHAWYQAQTGATPTAGVRRLSATEISWLITASPSFDHEVSKAACAQGVSGYKTMIMDGYGVVITPSVSGCAQPQVDPGTPTTPPTLPPGETLPENKNPPPVAIEPVVAKKKKDDSSAWGIIAFSVVGFGAALWLGSKMLTGKGK